MIQGWQGNMGKDFCSHDATRSLEPMEFGLTEFLDFCWLHFSDPMIFFIALSSHMFYSYAFYVTGKLWICDAKMRPNSRSNCASNAPLCSSIDHWTKSIAICQICRGETSLGRFGIVTCGQQASGDLDPERIQTIGHRYVVIH